MTKQTDEEAAAAEAAAKAKAAAKPRKLARAKGAATAVPGTLERLAAVIEGEAHHSGLGALVERLAAEEGLTLREDGPWTHAEMAGLDVMSGAGTHGALRAWAMAARRALQDLPA